MTNPFGLPPITDQELDEIVARIAGELGEDVESVRPHVIEFYRDLGAF